MQDNPRPRSKGDKQVQAFDWTDPFLLDELLTEEERMIRDTARAYAQDRLAPRIVPWVCCNAACMMSARSC